MIFPVEPALLPRFDRRESGYDRVPVPRNLIESVSWEALPTGGTIWAYVPKSVATPGSEPLLPDLNNPILQSYLDCAWKAHWTSGGTSPASSSPHGGLEQLLAQRPGDGPPPMGGDEAGRRH